MVAIILQLLYSDVVIGAEPYRHKPIDKTFILRTFRQPILTTWPYGSTGIIKSLSSFSVARSQEKKLSGSVVVRATGGGGFCFELYLKRT